MPVTFEETEDSIDDSVTNIIEATWHELKGIGSRLRKNMLAKALSYWIEEGYVVVPDDYMDED